MVLVQALAFWHLEETYAPTLLERKAARLRSETGDNNFRTKFDTQDRRWQAILRKGLIKPAYLFTHEPIVQVLAAIQMLVFGEIYLLLVTISSTFTTLYGWKKSVAGCTYIALGLGVLAAGQTIGRTIDGVYKRLTKNNGGISKPEFRL